MQKLLFMALLFAVASCDKNGSSTQINDFSSELTAAANTVILKTYQSLDEKMATLVAALTTLEASPTAPNLANAQQAWRDARLPWEQSEGFLFGPVDQQGIDPAMDSWPVNEVDLDAVLNSSDALTKTYLDAQEGTIKGFHTLEYLIFGKNSAKTVADFTPRQFEYLRAAAESLKGETHKLFVAWSPDGQNFTANLEKAGTSASIYPSQKSALEELVNGIITISDEVGNGKINDPYSQQNVTLEESRFSANSKADFADNIRSVRNIYFGTTDGAVGAASLSTVVLAKNSSLDSKIKSQIEAAISSIENIPGTFTVAIFESKPSVEAARTAVRDLQETLQSSLLPLVQSF